jgi:YegS/Rv2252/BmrU family lipid kinase
MEKRYGSMMLLVNPVAGRSTSHAALGTAVDKFCSAGYHPVVFYTDKPGAARSLTAEYAGEHEFLVCLGGDGTLSDTISGLMEIPEEKRPHLGYIPMGTANDVATTLGLPMRLPALAALQILRGEPLPYDVGEMTSVGYFTYIAAFGAFTEVSYKTDQDLKHSLGHLAYVIEGINSLATIRDTHARVEYDDGVAEGNYVYGAVSNAVSIGGMVKMDRKRVNLSDGKFEVLLVQKPRDPIELSTLVTAILTQNYESCPCITFLQSTNVRVTFDEPVPWTRDGEDGGQHETLELHCHTRAVNIVC